jgi:hypothetical protein
VQVGTRELERFLSTCVRRRTVSYNRRSSPPLGRLTAGIAHEIKNNPFFTTTLAGEEPDSASLFRMTSSSSSAAGRSTSRPHPARSPNPTIAVHNGRVVKRTGDGAIVEFRSVVDAVRKAVAAGEKVD